MVLDSNPRIYDSIGTGYRQLRVPDRRIFARIQQALGDARTVCNVGAGAGSYEPDDRHVTAVEPSPTMIAQRTSSNRVVRASAENMPFADDEFDAAMAVLTIHHWTNAREGLAEMRRISRRQVIFTFDPDFCDSLWLVRDYLPEIAKFEHRRAIPIRRIIDSLNNVSVETVEIPFDCSDGFQGAYWRRPSEYLQADVRAAISTLMQLPQDIVSRALRRLSQDLQSGEWQRRYNHLIERESLDLGYRLVVVQSSAA